MRTVLFLHLSALLLSSLCFAEVRSVYPGGDEIVSVRTKLGMATLIYVPAPILPSIIGDQSSFRIDLMPDFMSVKPLRFGAKTNLFVMTERRRFNVHLLTVSSGPSDDILYLKEKPAGENVTWRPFQRSAGNADFRLTIERIGLSREGFLLLDGRLTSKEMIAIRPDEFQVVQGGKTRPIEHLFISEKTLSTRRPILFGLSLARADFERAKRLTIEWRGRRSLSLTIPEDLLWK